MKSLLTVSLAAGFTPLVKKGEKVKADQPIAQKPKKVYQEKIPLSRLLKIPPAKIAGCLTKKLGSHIKKGELIAKKEGFFKSLRVLSPFSATLTSLDLKDGSLLLTIDSTEEMVEKAPIAASVEEVSQTEITLSFNGKIIQAEKGKGNQVIAPLLFFDKSQVDLHHFGSETTSKIIAAKAFNQGARAKLNALGTKGIVALEYYEDFPVVVKVTPSDLKQLENYQGKRIILLGEACRIIIPFV